MSSDSDRSAMPAGPAQLLSSGYGKPKFHARTKRFLKAQIQNRTFGELALLVKFLVIVLVTVVPAILTFIVIAKAMVETNIVMTALRVPQSLDAMGYTSETSTQRLLDEISSLNKASHAAKPKTAFGDNQIAEALSSIETPAGNLDIKSFQSLIQRVLGQKIIQISGEITTRKEGAQEFLRLRLRPTVQAQTASGFPAPRLPLWYRRAAPPT